MHGRVLTLARGACRACAFAWAAVAGMRASTFSLRFLSSAMGRASSSRSTSPPN